MEKKNIRYSEKEKINYALNDKNYKGILYIKYIYDEESLSFMSTYLILGA